MNGLFENREIFALAVAAFFASAACALVAPSRLRGGARAWAEKILAGVAWAALSWALFERGTARAAFPVSDVFEIFQCLGWFAVFFVVFLRVVWTLRVPTVFGAAAAGTLCAAGFAGGSGWDAAPVPADAFAATTSPWAGVHAGFVTVGYACFSAAAMVWLIYLIQNRALRERRTGAFFSRLPDLASLDRIGGRLCAAGTVIFGVGAALGVAVLAGGGRLASAFALYKAALAVAMFFGFSAATALRRLGRLSALKFARVGLGIFVAALVFLGGSACVKNATDAAVAAPDAEIAEEAAAR